MSKRRMLAIIGVGCLAVFCAELIPGLASAEAPAYLPRRYVPGDVPQYYQSQMECGPVAMRMVLEYYEIELSTSAIKEEVGTDESGGTRSEDLVEYPKSLGLKARAVYGNIDELAKSIAGGYPVIVRQWKNDEAKSEATVSHYRVVIGYDYDQQMIYMRDPSRVRVVRGFIPEVQRALGCAKGKWFIHQKLDANSA